MENAIRTGIRKLIEGENLSFSECKQIIRNVMSSEATDSQIAAFLTALRIKGETTDEIAASASIMREFCHKINPQVDGRLIDTCGTGGDSIKTFNVSTAAAFVIAGADVPVAKHGNRAVSSRCGSADVLERLGLPLNVKPKIVEEAIEKVGIGFLYAPKFHSSMMHVSTPRREIGVRTIFNILGPLTNPAGVKAQVIGVYDQALTQKLATVLNILGCEEAMVVHGLCGMDEISTISETAVCWLKKGKIKNLIIKPEDLGVKRSKPEELTVTSINECVETMLEVLSGILPRGEPKRDLVVVNAAAGILVGGKGNSLRDCVSLAEESIDGGAAYEKLRDLIEFCGGDLSRIDDWEKKYV